jgi:Na+-driven multidrug efflux pump
MWWYFSRLEKYVRFDSALFKPQLAAWKRILQVGVPPGGEFALMFVYMAVIYSIIGHFGAAAQAGFGVGSRVMQAIFLPAMAIAFATAPLAGQNVGAGQFSRVRQTFNVAALIGSVIMLVLTLLCQWQPTSLIRVFTQDAAVIAVASEFLQIISFNFVASGLIFTCSGMFQALGNTVPALLSSASRLLTFVLPAIWLSHQVGFTLHSLWLLSVASVAVQALLSCVLLWRALQVKSRAGISIGAPA